MVICMDVLYYCKSCFKPCYLRYDGYCQSCWRYFNHDKYKQFDLPEYGKIGYVTDVNDKQYGMVICHICGKAFTKLQQHIYYSHNVYKKDYCKQFGIDNKSRLTSEEYHSKMSNYAYQYDMPEQLKVAGAKTRFKTGHNNNYTRSAMTKERLSKNCFIRKSSDESEVTRDGK